MGSQARMGDVGVEPRTAGDDVMASAPSTTGAHWANRDNAPGSRHSGDRGTTFRRPPAANSYEDAPAPAADEFSPSAYLPDLPPTSWFADADRRGRDSAGLPTRTPGRSLTDDPPVRPSSADKGGYVADSTDRAAYLPSGKLDTGAVAAGRGADGRAGAGKGSDNPVADRSSRPGAEHSDEPATSGTDSYRPAPEFGPAPPATPGRVSFGVSAGPISPSHRPVSPGAPAVPVQRPTSPAATPAGAMSAGVRAAGASSAMSSAGTGSIPRVGPFADAGPADTSSRAYGSETIYKQAHRAPAEPPRRRSRLLVLGTAVLTAMVLLGGVLAGMAYFSGDDRSMKDMLLGAPGDDRTVSAPLGGRTTAAFELVAATTKATVRTADLGGDLYRITAPDGSGVKPSPVLSNDRVQLLLTPDGERASGDVDVLLSSKVSWSLRFTAAADEQVVDLSGGRITGLDVLGGTRRFSLKLPKPVGTVPVRVTGAIEDFSIQSPVGNPVRVQVDSGAKTVAAGKVTLKDVKPGSTLTPKDWKATNRYDVQATARLTLLSVANAG
jgi:hypothetical protein